MSYCGEYELWSGVWLMYKNLDSRVAN